MRGLYQLETTFFFFGNRELTIIGKHELYCILQCKVPTLPLCCDTKSCQKILKSLHELGDGSCNYLSYCLAAGALPHCCRPPLWSVLRLFALFLSQLRAPSPRWASRRPSPLAPTGEDARRARLRRDTPCSFWEKFCFSWPGPKPGFASVSSTPRNLGRADGAAASTHTQAHTPNAAFCVCVCGFPAPPFPCWRRMS